MNPRPAVPGFWVKLGHFDGNSICAGGRQHCGWNREMRREKAKAALRGAAFRIEGRECEFQGRKVRAGGSPPVLGNAKKTSVQSQRSMGALIV